MKPVGVLGEWSLLSHHFVYKSHLVVSFYIAEIVVALDCSGQRTTEIKSIES